MSIFKKNNKTKKNTEKMKITDIEFQGNSVKIILNNMKYKKFFNYPKSLIKENKEEHFLIQLI
mgnify:CR=1 FL=1